MISKGHIRIAAAVTLLMAGALAHAADGVSAQEKLQFTQKNVQAQMQELQTRMFELAELTRQSEPDSALRLVLAVRKAREGLILEQMKDVADLLAANDMAKATAESRQVIAKLEALRQLLVSLDIDLQLQLERLRKLQAALHQLDEIQKAETQQKKQSDALAADQKKGTTPPKDVLASAQQKESGNQQRTNDLTQSVKDIGNVDAAVQALGGSSGHMQTAAKDLGGGNASDASGSQQDALQKLAQARDALEKERQKTLDELQRQVKAVVVQNLKEMLDRQTATREATTALAARINTDRAALLQLEQLATPEQRIAAICHQTLDLVNETEFSIALPPALEDLEKRMLVVSGELTEGHGDAPVVAMQAGIEHDLKDLLDTFQNMGSIQQGLGQCKSCGGNRNKLLAELKVVRMLQVRVNTGTIGADRQRAALQILSPELRTRIGTLRDGEAGVHEAMERLHEQYCPDCFTQ